MKYRIYYTDGSVMLGEDRVDWQASPDQGVQVVVDMDFDGHSGSTYNGLDGQPILVKGRYLWTGQESYNPWGWGAKEGELIDSKSYWKIWEQACADR